MLQRLLLLKLDKPDRGTIYWPFLATNEALGLVGVEYNFRGGLVWGSTYASLDAKIQPADGCVSSFNNRRPCLLQLLLSIDELCIIAVERVISK